MSIGQDICRAVTNGEWKLPKHILLCATLRHLFRSTQLITLMNRLGHCENNSYASELESAIATTLQESSSLLTNQITRVPRSILFHSEWDNFNQKLTRQTNVQHSWRNHATGSQADEEIEDTDPVPVRHSSEASHIVDHYEPLPDFYVKKSGPEMDIQLTEQPIENVTAYNDTLQTYFIWMMCRTICSSGKQAVLFLNN